MIVSQRVQHILGRTWRITLKLAGMYSSISETSSPNFESPPPHAEQASPAGICVWVSRGRCSGSGRRFRFRPGVLVLPVGAAAGGRAASPVSNSSSFNSSCSTSRAIFSLLVPNIMRRSLAMISFRCSISLLRVSSFSCCATTRASSASRFSRLRSTTLA